MNDAWNDLLACLELATVAGTAGPVLQFEGRNQTLEYRRVFGGQVLAQFVEAARRSCPDKSVKSLHTVFPREGRAEEPICYSVLRQHEGRSFAALSITATQSAGAIGTATVSMHIVEGGRDHQDLDYAGGQIPQLPGPEHVLDSTFIPWETRTIGNLHDSSAGPPEFELWMRTPPVSADLAPALTSYATDLTLIGTALRPIEGFDQSGTMTAFTSAVTSHTVWFHRPFRSDQWLLLRQHSPILAHGRTFGRGDVLTADGLLVASYAQEALVRFKR